MDQFDIAIIGGLGHVGLPFGLALADRGQRVIAIDTDQNRRNSVLNKKLPFNEPGFQTLLERNLNKSFFVTDDFKMASLSRAIVIIIYSSISNFDVLAKQLVGVLHKDHVIIIRSTVAPGTADQLKKLIESNTSFRVGKDVFLAVAPERIAQGHALDELHSLPQIVGVYDDMSFGKVQEIFSFLGTEVIRASPLEAELAKIYSNVQRYISFAISNEFFMIADQLGVNAHIILQLANYRYPRGIVKFPGFAKGPCLAKDSLILTNTVSAVFSKLTRAAYEVNESLPEYCLNRMNQYTPLNDKVVALLGLTFKKDCDDVRDSCALDILNYLGKKSIKVITHDPFTNPVNLGEVLKEADVVLISTNHSYYEALGISNLKELAGKNLLICDPWNVLKTGQFIFWLNDV